MKWITLITSIFICGFAHAETASLCSAINHCQVEKKTWGKKGWNSDYLKELDFKSFCLNDRPTLQVEPELGIELWLFDGKKDVKDGIKSGPYVSVNLFTYKLTYVVATGEAPLSSAALGFSHRLTPKGKSVIEVSCFKK